MGADYYILMATVISVRQVLHLDWKKLEDKITIRVDPTDAAMLPYRKRLVNAWAWLSHVPPVRRDRLRNSRLVRLESLHGSGAGGNTPCA